MFAAYGVERARGNLRGDNGYRKINGGAEFFGGSWNRAGKKRGAGEEDEQQCVGSQKPDALALDYGKTYQLDGINDDLFNELYEHALNGTAERDILDVYASFGAEN